MKINHSKFNYTKEECDIMLEHCKHLQESHPGHVPILIMSKSSILKMDKQKFLVSNDIVFSNFITDILKKKLIGLNENDTLKICTVKLNPNGEKSKSTEISLNSSLMKNIYNEFKDESTNFLIFKVSRNTTYKYLKETTKYLLGY